MYAYIYAHFYILTPTAAWMTTLLNYNDINYRWHYICSVTFNVQISGISKTRIHFNEKILWIKYMM